MAAISKELWAQLAPLLDQALELDADGRAALVARLRETAPQAADELGALLAAEADPQFDLLGAGPAPAGWSADLAGRSIDKYTLDRPLGRGGMGTVWLAHRNDGRFEGAVAIKLLNLALVGRAGEERFAQEGKLLARLAHPNIARLLDAGVAGAQPFLVLEYVDGERIDEFADRRRLAPADRIRLCLQVLDALAIAHANLVIHRDIKPSNILVTPTGSVKLLDFGIAKLLLEGRPVGEATTLTDSAGRALTPEYAAPEVVLGEPVSAATDVYSTGVLLYALLSGRHPTAEGCATAAAHLRTVVETEPGRLSEAVTRLPPGLARADSARRAAARGATPERLRRLYRGDLDNILAKALKKAPAERYQTAAELRDDLRRYLDYQPVAARPDALGYRVRKFARRHRGALLAGGLVAASLIGGTAVSLHQMRIAQRERDRAQNALHRSEASTGFESLLFRLIDPGGEAITYRQLLDRGRLVLDRQFKGDPVARIQVGVQFAQNYLRAGDDTAAAAVLTRTVAIADSATGPHWQARARCELAIAIANEAPDSSRALISAAARLLEQVPDPEVGTLNACDQAGGAWGLAANRPDSAATFFQRQLQRMIATGDSGKSGYLFALNDYVLALFRARRPRQAAAAMAEVLALAHAGASGDPRTLPVTQFNAFVTYELLGEPVLTRKYVAGQVALDLAADTAREASPLLRFLYGQAFEDLEQPDSAAFWYRRALERPDRLGPIRSQVARLRLARLAQVRGDAVEAERYREAARAPAKTTADALEIGASRRDVEIETARGRLGELGAGGKTGPALDSAVAAALAGFHYAESGRATYLVRPLVAAADLLLRAGRCNTADRYARQLVRIGSIDSLAATTSGVGGEGLLLQAEAEEGQGHPALARQLVQQSVPALSVGLGPDHPRTRAARALADSLGRRS